MRNELRATPFPVLSERHFRQTNVATIKKKFNEEWHYRTHCTCYASLPLSTESLQRREQQKLPERPISVQLRVKLLASRRLDVVDGGVFRVGRAGPSPSSTAVRCQSASVRATILAAF